MFYWVLT
jgi:hypothetical protein